jgi:hypothetical protein
MTSIMKRYTYEIALALVVVTSVLLGACKAPRGNDAPHRPGHGTTSKVQMTRPLR